MLARIPEATARELYLQQAARRLGLMPATLVSDVAAALRGASSPRPLRVSAVPLPELPVAPSSGGDGQAQLLPPPPTWERHLATLCVHRPELAARLTGELGLDLTAIQHPLTRRMLEVALATPAGEPFPLTSLPAPERDLAAELLVRTVPELLPESRVGDLDTSIADCLQRVAEARMGAEITDVRRRMAGAKERGDDAEVARLAARLRVLATASPHLRRTAASR
jgi:hypothetical protein